MQKQVENLESYDSPGHGSGGGFGCSGERL